MRIGVIGAGQLGQMLALAGFPLALQFRFLDPAADSPAGRVAPVETASFDDEAGLARLADAVDLVTYEFENVPVAALQRVAATHPVWPPVEALRISQDRLLEKTLFGQLDVPTPPFRAVDTRAELGAAVAQVGLPCVLKTRRLGYDGRGQCVLRRHADLATAWSTLGGQPLILEGFVRFEREVSLIAVRSTAGETRFYPLVDNQHRAGILHRSLAPYRNATLQRLAERHGRALLDHFGYAGVLTIEFFAVGRRLIANEMAPRVHNSGHWTIEGAMTSQFENHLRAILGWPLGDTRPTGHSAMVNFVGAMPSRARVLGLPGLHHHDYGKTPRPGRKLGHGTVVAASPAAAAGAVARIERLLPRAKR